MEAYDNHLKFAVEYFKENLSAFPDILGFGNTLINAKHLDLVLNVCEYGFKKVNHHEGKRSEVDTRRKLMNQRERKLDEERLLRKPPVYTKEEEAELETIKKTKAFFDNLPITLRYTEAELRKFNVDLASLMIRAALQFQGAGAEDKLQQIVGQCSNQMLKARDIFTLAQGMEANKWDLVIKLCEDAAVRVGKEEPADRAHADENELLRKETITHALNIIIDRLHGYTNAIAAKDILTKEQKADYERLKTGEQIESILEFWVPTHLPAPDYMIEVAQLLLTKKHPSYVLDFGAKLAGALPKLEQQQDEREVLRSKLNHLKDKIAAVKADRKQVPKELQDEFNAAEEALVFEKFLPSYMFGNVPAKTDALRLQLDKVSISAMLELQNTNKGKSYETEFLKIMDYSRNPKNLHALADHLLSQKESEMAIKFGEKCQRLIKEVEQQREVHAPLDQQLQQLKIEEGKLNAQNKHLPAEKKEQQKKLEDQIAKLPKWPKFADLHDFHQYDQLNLDVVKTMVSAISAKKERIYERGSQKEKDEVDAQVTNIVNLCLEKFSDPTKLMEFAKHMQSCKQPEIVLQVVDRVFSQIKNINKQREDRLKVQRAIDKIKKEEQALIAEKKKEKLNVEKVANLKKLEEELATLPPWPHFAELEDVAQFDKTKGLAAQLLVTEALKICSDLEANIKKRHFEDPSSANEAKETEQRKAANNKLQSSIRLCLDNIKNPRDLYALAKTLKEDPASVLDVALQCHQKAEELQEKCTEIDELEQKLQVLQQEKAELGKFKKDLPVEDLKTLEELQVALQAPRPGFTLKELDDLHNQVGVYCISCAFESKVELKKKIANKDFDAKQAAKLEKEDIPKNTQRSLDLCRDFVNDPKTLIEIAEDLGTRFHEHTGALEVGNLCLERLTNLQEFTKERAEQVKERQALLEEKQNLDKLRRKLTAPQAARLRELEIDDRVNKLRPSYYSQEILTFDNWCLEITKVMVRNSLKIEAHYVTTIDQLDEAPPASVVAQEKKRLGNNTKEVVTKCLDQMVLIQNLLFFATFLDEIKEYSHLITVGDHIEKILDNMRVEQEKYEEKLIELKKFEQQFLQQKDEAEKKKIEAKIAKRKEEVANLEQTVRSWEEISALTLQITTLMIKAATAEDLGEVLRDQTILAFKVDNTPERWDQVRALCSEEEWETTKNELVGYVMKRDENVAAKIELLLKDGLYEQCISIFPRPSVSEDPEDLDKQIDLLQKLYAEVDRHALKHLDKLLPVVQRYAKRCFQEWKFEKMSDIMDIMQTRYPDMIVSLYSSACDLLLLNILQSQYPAFISLMKDLKARLNNLGLPEQWSDFLAEFKKKHNKKKKLIQMLNIIGDSGWSLEAMVKQEDSKGKRKSPAASSTTAAKKQKVTPTPTASKASTPIPSKPLLATPINISTKKEAKVEKKVEKKKAKKEESEDEEMEDASEDKVEEQKEEEEEEVKQPTKKKSLKDYVKKPAPVPTKKEKEKEKKSPKAPVPKTTPKKVPAAKKRKVEEEEEAEEEKEEEEEDEPVAEAEEEDAEEDAEDDEEQGTPEIGDDDE